MRVLAALFVLILVGWTSGCGDDTAGDDGGRSDAEGPLCTGDRDCDDGTFCNGRERCRPGTDGADARGCVAASSPCLSGQSCNEDSDRCITDCGAVTDADGDGHDAIECGGDDCADSDPQRFPGNIEVCDGRGHDEDCDPSTFGRRDMDGDGAVDATCCDESGDGTPSCGKDCDDGNPAVRKGQFEICDEQDNDCDGEVDEDTSAVDWYPDADGDGFGDAEATEGERSCTPVEGRSSLQTDCDDEVASVHPGAFEACNRRDDDCDGRFDEGTPDADGDTIRDECDTCEGEDDTADADGDGVPDGCDACAGADDTVDEDGDGIVDGCDLCEGDNSTYDLDDDGVCDGPFVDESAMTSFTVSVQPGFDGVPGIAWSPDGSYLAVLETRDTPGDRGRALEVYRWDGSAAERVVRDSLPAATEYSHALAWRPDAGGDAEHIAVMAGGDLDKTVHVYEFSPDSDSLGPTARQRFMTPFPTSSMYHLDWSADGSRLCAMIDLTLVTASFDGASLTLDHVVSGQAYRGDFYAGCSWAPSGERFAVGLYDNSSDPRAGVRIYDASGASLETLVTDTEVTRAFDAAWSPDVGGLVASAESAERIRYYRVDLAEASMSLAATTSISEIARIGSLAWHPDGLHVAAVGKTKLTILGLRRLEGDYELVELTQVPHGSEVEVYGGTFSPDGESLAVRHGAEVDIYSLP